MAILLRRRCRLGVGWLSMIGRIFLSTIVMAIFLIALANFGAGFRHNIPAVLWLTGLVIFGAGTFLAMAFLFRAIPPSLVRLWRH